MSKAEFYIIDTNVLRWVPWLKSIYYKSGRRFLDTEIIALIGVRISWEIVAVSISENSFSTFILSYFIKRVTSLTIIMRTLCP
jgi:hypothetical protein